ncbi:MAG: AAA family ATPase, partial [Oscillospiraceae bacterium]|nr:AAA family ATPase [Oscillospiraceae bacterium]
MQVIDLADNINLHVFALCYGASGTGKTHLMGTVGELGSVLHVDIDKGIKTLKYAPDLQNGCLDNTTVISFDQFKDLNELYQLVDANDPEKWSKKFGIPVAKPYDWIIYDTWSE